MKTTILTARLLAWLHIGLGTVHCAFTPIVMKDIPASIHETFLFMFLCTGIAYLYFGIVLLTECKKLKSEATSNQRLLLGTVILIAGVGATAIACMPANPFTWLSGLPGIIGAAIILSKLKVWQRISYMHLFYGGSLLMLLVALLHVYIAIKGGELYIYFGAGEEMFRMDQAGSFVPMITTLILAVLFFVASLYGLSGTDRLPSLPFQRIIIPGIAVIFSLRGLVVFYELVKWLHTGNADVIRYIAFSGYSLITGSLYLLGIIKRNKQCNELKTFWF